MSRPLRRGLAPLLAGLLLGLAWPAPAFVPSAARIATALAKANRKAGRARPLELDVVVRIDEIEVAAGTWLTDPRGMGRLELHHQKGFDERHLLLFGNHLAARDGKALRNPHVLLPPLAWMQAGDATALLARLGSLGIATDQVALGYEGDHDCWVIGGRGGGPAAWIDMQTRAPVRLDWQGVRIWVGPDREEGGIRVPAWLEVEAADSDPVRLEIRGFRPTVVTPETFASAWLGS